MRGGCGLVRGMRVHGSVIRGVHVSSSLIGVVLLVLAVQGSLLVVVLDHAGVNTIPSMCGSGVSVGGMTVGSGSTGVSVGG